MAKEILEMPIETATMELPDTKTIKLKWPEGYHVDFKTGQFITLCKQQVCRSGRPWKTLSLGFHAQGYSTGLPR